MAGTVVQGDPAAAWTRASLDSRKVEGGELFFALRGEQVDGHDYVASALQRGAAAAVVERDVAAPSGGGVIRVDSVYGGLHALTRAMRQEVPKRLVGITGSSGKTTTKELLALCLERRWSVAKTQGNFNNLLGFPLTLLATPEGTEWLVAEMGMSAPGELAEISRLGSPDVALFTNVRPVHLEGLGSLEAIAKAKSELLAGLRDGGLVVANADDPWVRRIATSHAGPVVWYSAEGDAPYAVRDLGARAGAVGSRFTLVTPEGEVAIELPLHGAYNAENFLAAAACAHALGVPLAELPAAALAAAPVGGRGAVTQLAAGGTLIDDSYNSNPVALQKALESGPDGPRFHRECGEGAARLGFSPVVGVGTLSRDLVAGAASGGAKSTHWFATADEAAEWAREAARPGDVVLVKASRGVRLEKVVAALTGQAAGGGH
jgi:UDP-N-acetylmuramoyl-tripeptide--D-alanyl-D-alanine ligase